MLPPLDLPALYDLLARLQPVSADRRLILVGGQALALWSAQLAEYDEGVDAELATSIDIDFQATPADARSAAQQLGIEILVPSIDDITPNSGVASFIDAAGYSRELDFIDAPYGLDADDVRDTAFEVVVRREGDGDATFWVMNPQRCLHSRVANLNLPGKSGPLAIGQLRVAVAITRAFGRWLLDVGEPPRSVYRLNERVFELAYYDRRALRAWAEFDVDVVAALTVDDRLSEAHLRVRQPQMRQPQMRQLVDERRAAYVRRTDRNNECASRRSPQPFVVPERTRTRAGDPDTAAILDELREERF